MKRGISAFVLTLLLAALAHQVLPWYALLLAALLISLILRPGAGAAWWAGFAAGLLLWGGQAWLAYTGNEGVLAGRVGQLFGGLSGPALLAVTALLGGLSGGLGALTGALARRLTS